MNYEGDGINAIKAKCGRRAYGWFQHYAARPAFIISHVIPKKRNKLDPADLARAVAARKVVEKQARRQERAEGASHHEHDPQRVARRGP